MALDVGCSWLAEQICTTLNGYVGFVGPEFNTFIATDEQFWRPHFPTMFRFYSFSCSEIVVEVILDGMAGLGTIEKIIARTRLDFLGSV